MPTFGERQSWNKVKAINQKELRRQFRVLDQMLSMHGALVGRYSRLSVLIDVSLLACAVIFCATTFVSDSFFTSLGVTPQTIRFVLGAASIVALLVSIMSLRVDWKAKETRHIEAMRRLTIELAKYRELRNASGIWSAEASVELNGRYWQLMDNIAPIPERFFVRLKARHLRKVEASKLLDEFAGLPIIILRFVSLVRAMRRLLTKGRDNGTRE